jgi:hypothetical protein
VGNRVGSGQTGPDPTLLPTFLMVQAIFEPNLFPYKYPNISQT